MKLKADNEYRKGNFTEAIKYYSSGVLSIRMLIREGNIDLETLNTKYVKQLILPCNLNMSLCLLKTGMYEKCIKVCDDALKIDKNSVRAYMRKGKALEITSKVLKILKWFQNNLIPLILS